MVLTDEILFCDLAAPGIEVVTMGADGRIVSIIHGGRLDGERYDFGDLDAESAHSRTCRLARMTGWARRER